MAGCADQHASRKRKQTAKAAIDTHEQMKAGPHFAVGNTTQNQIFLVEYYRK